MILNQLKKKYIEAIYKEKAFLIKKDYFKLHHGGESHLYLNHREFLDKYKYLDLLAQAYIEMIPKGLKNFKLGALDSQMSPVLCGLIAAKIKKDIVLIKEHKTDYGLEQNIYGDPSGEILLIDDMTSTGTMPINAVDALRKKGAKVRYLIVSAVRDMTAIENMSEAGIETFYVATFDEILKTLWKKLPKEEQKSVQREVAEKGYKWDWLIGKIKIRPVIEKYNKRSDAVNSLACVGLDSDYAKLPVRFRTYEYPQFEFNKWIINQTHEYVGAFKANIAFYEARGDKGIKELKMTLDYLRRNHPDIFLICDSKRGDIGNTNYGYVALIMDWLGFDAMTLHPYLGMESLKPFLDRKDKGCIILCQTSNPGSGELQNLTSGGKPFWQVIAESVRDEWNYNDNCLLVVGATYPEETRRIRKIVGNMTFLMPGVGAQGGNVKEAVQSAINSKGKGFILNSSRGVIFSKNPKEEAKKLRDEINNYR
jgi:orotidine-5'-phosphate decarboxylase